MDTATAELLTDVVKILGPSILTVIVGIKVAKYQIQIEKIKLFDKDRAEAYRSLLCFVRKLKNQTFPLAQNKINTFKDIMEQAYFNSVELNSMYFDEASMKILDEFESRYFCMTNPDLIPEMDSQEEREFLDEKLFNMCEELETHVRNVVRKLRISN